MSFTRKIAIELINAGESEQVASERAARRDWLMARDYRVLWFEAAFIERDVEPALVDIAALQDAE